MVTLEIVKLLRSGELAVNSNSPVYRVVKLCIFIHNDVYFICLTETELKRTHLEYAFENDK